MNIISCNCDKSFINIFWMINYSIIWEQIATSKRLNLWLGYWQDLICWKIGLHLLSCALLILSLDLSQFCKNSPGDNQSIQCCVRHLLYGPKSLYLVGKNIGSLLILYFKITLTFPFKLCFNFFTNDVTNCSSKLPL